MSWRVWCCSHRNSLWIGRQGPLGDVRRRSLLPFALIGLILAGCASGPRSPQYGDPLAGFASATSISIPSNVEFPDFNRMSLGLIVSENTEATVLFMEANVEYMKGFVIPNTVAIDDQNARYIVERVSLVLKEKFGRVTLIGGVADL